MKYVVNVHLGWKMLLIILTGDLPAIWRANLFWRERRREHSANSKPGICLGLHIWSSRKNQVDALTNYTFIVFWL